MSHCYKVKVYYEDTDAGGVVYHASYLRFLERARTELLTEEGFDPAGFHGKGQYFVVTRVDIRYLKGVRLGETMEVLTGISDIKHASAMLNQRCVRGGETVAEADVSIAFIDQNGKPRRLPEGFAEKMGKRFALPEKD
jgi:acyl-CoA thioester hydrolase